MGEAGRRSAARADDEASFASRHAPLARLAYALTGSSHDARDR